MEEPKLQLLPGGTESSCTFVMSREDHTLGNALRFVCMRDARTQFCGYSMPHPSEQVVNLRLQTVPPATSLDVFSRGLQTLVDMCEHIEASLGAAQAPQDEGEEEAGGGGGGGGGGGAQRGRAGGGGRGEEEAGGEEEEGGASAAAGGGGGASTVPSSSVGAASPAKPARSSRHK
jgi:DNA-directed RNA polymerase I and III subunit RPAC2